MGSCQNFSSSPIFIVSKVKLGKWVLTRGFGMGVGCVVANYFHGGYLEEAERIRQKAMREYVGEFAEIEDLRDKMWSAGVRKRMSSVGTFYQTRAEKIWKMSKD